MRAHPVARLRNGISTAAMAAALCLASPALAQTETGQLQGHVDGAASGTQVVATDTATGQRRTVTVDASGDYSMIGLRPSTYRVTVEGKPEQQTTLLLGQTAVVDFVDAAASASGAGDVVVTGRTVREVRTPTVSTNITPAQIENLPQNQRNFLNFADLAPGLQVTRGGNAQIQAGATSSSNTNVLLDGLSLKNPINHGGIFGQNFGLGNPFPQSAIQEYQVQTQNFGAETGQTGSALITAITKTGGDQFHGSAFLQYQPRAFITQPYFDQRRNVPKPEYSRKQFGGEFGGPIIPGTLTFYVAGEGLAANLPSTTGATNNVPTSVASLINVSRNGDFHQGLYFGKLTWFANNDDTINLEAFIRRENNLADIDGNATPSHGRTILTHQDRYQVQWRHTSGDLFNLLNIAYERAEQSTPSQGSGPEYLISNAFAPGVACPASESGGCNIGGFDFNARAQLGANSFTQGDTQKIYTLKDDATLSRGDHTIRFGGQIVHLDLQREVSDHFNGSFYYFNPGPGGTFDPATNIPFGITINTAPTPRVTGQDTQFGAYIQDEWRPDTHLTVNLGIRYDLETNQNNNSYVTPPAIAAALRNYQGWRARGIDPEDYISDGHNRHPEYGAIQPRIGVSYDVFGDRDLVVFGGVGRYFDRSLFIEGVIEQLTNSNRTSSYAFCNAPGAVAGNCIAFTRDPAVARQEIQALNLTGGSVFVLNNHTPLPFSDQIDFGIRKRFGAIQTSLTFSHIESHNIFQFTRANFYSNGWYSRILQTAPGPNNTTVVTGCTDGGDTFIQDNTPGNNYAACPAQNGQLTGFQGKLDRGQSQGRSHYNAIYFQADKPFTDTSSWGFTTALTVQLARTNDAQELNSDEFFNGPAQTVYGTHFANGVEKYRLVTTANWRAPLGLTLSGNLTLTSGASFGNVIFGVVPDGACCYGNFGGKFYPRQFIAYKRLDLRVAKTFRMPWDHGHELTVDFQAFNAFNWLNRQYNSWGSGSGNPAPLTEESQIGNDARSFQAGVRYKF